MPPGRPVRRQPGKHRLFVIDGSKALRVVIGAVFGTHNPVQRCRHHKIENVSGYLPKGLKEQVKLVMRAAYHLPEKKGLAKLEEQADWLEKSYPSAAASLREGLEETFTINRLGLPATLRRCLGTTNLVESPNAGMRLRTRRVTRWPDTKMILGWAAAAYVETDRRCGRAAKHFRRTMGYQSLSMLEAALREEKAAQQHEEKEVVEGDQSGPPRFLQAVAA